MDYAAIYARLVARAKSRVLTGYREKHHVIPKCLGGSDDDENVVELTAEEHYVAHQLLLKMYPAENGLLFAAMFMTTRKGNKVYGWCRKRMSERMKGKNNPYHTHPKTSKLKRGNVRKAFSAEERAAIRERMRASNPCKGVDPWEHPRATVESKQIWKDANWYYEKWKETGWGYHKLAKSRGFDGPTMTHNNMVNRFKNGWIPESCKL